MKLKNYITLCVGLFLFSLVPCGYFLTRIDSVTEITGILMLVFIVVYAYCFEFILLAKIRCPNCEKSIVSRTGLFKHLSINKCHFCKTSFNVPMIWSKNK